MPEVQIDLLEMSGENFKHDVLPKLIGVRQSQSRVVREPTHIEICMLHHQLVDLEVLGLEIVVDLLLASD
jgi:type III secretory pathway component EscU